MKFPEKHTCHDGGWPTPSRPGEWRPSSDDQCWRTCSYCGSMHPEDLLRLITEDKIASFGGADWKYGWPHKFYVDVKNPETEKLFNVGGRSWTDEAGVRRHEDTMGTRRVFHGKFYNEHLEDEGYDDEAWTALAKALEERGGIAFERVTVDGKTKLKYRAPYGGYQR